MMLEGILPRGQLTLDTLSCSVRHIPGNEKPMSSLNTANPVVDLKDHAWIGGSMDLERKQGGRVVICAPRWVNQYAMHKMTGLCYYASIDELDKPPASRLTPTNSRQNAKFTLGNKVYNYFQLSQAGMSVHLTPQNEDVGMILGAPGLMNWKGGLIEYLDGDVFDPEGKSKRSIKEKQKTFLLDPHIVNPFYFDQSESFDYLGYQVSAGHFFNKSELLYAATAPRGARCKGYVVILAFPTPLKPTSPYVFYNKKEGQELGEYFGYSIAVGDLNKDDYDDLVVGAPFYSNKGSQREIGRIHVFLGSPGMSLQKPKFGHLIEGTAIDGRFGLTVASLGDINQDGHDDIAVGAPYEDGHRGVVYIYNGGPNGLKAPYSQRIAAADVDLSLRGFGISISPPDDMDSNSFDDVAIGAFLSGHTVLFRTYPVVHLELKVKSSVNVLHNDTTNFSVEICQSFNDKSEASHSVNVSRTLRIDEELQRFEYNDNVKVVTLWRGRTLCERVSVHLKSREETVEDVKITVNQEIVKRVQKRNAIWIKADSDPSGEDHFCKSCPVEEEALSVKEKSLTLPYARECVICTSDLHLSCEVVDAANFTSLNNQYILGSNNKIYLVINVTVDGDVSYGTSLSIKLPTIVDIVKLPSEDCVEVQDFLTHNITCKLKGAVRRGSPKTMMLGLDMISVKTAMNKTTGIVPDVEFQVEVRSKSEELNITDNTLKYNLKVNSDADFKLFGYSKNELYPYIKNGEEVGGDFNVTFHQIYQAIKTGLSPVRETKVVFSVPTLWISEGTHFLSMSKPEGKLRGQTVKCSSDGAMNFLNQSTEVLSDTENDIDGDLQQGEQVEERAKRSVLSVESEEHSNYEDLNNTDTSDGFNYFDDEYQSNRTFYLNCSMPEVECTTVTCHVTHEKAQSLEFELAMLLNISALELLMEDKDIIQLSTNAKVSIVNPINMTHSDSNGPDHAVVTSIFIRKELPPQAPPLAPLPPEEGVEIWIIILAVVASVLLLVLLILGLIKAGFFRRKKKEELEDLKNADNVFVAGPSPALQAPQQSDENGMEEGEDC
ncbi:integrin alpha-PS5 [Anabrus simplex]|uniref:integrin alpha-PS5 n=1 Tax=Anabrus simplex TaxID=316456 RepID=UPI0035A2711A